MKLYLIRHGRQNSRRCNVNVPVDEAGRRQAELAGARLKEYGAEKIFASELLRAEETAEILGLSKEAGYKLGQRAKQRLEILCREEGLL